MNIKQIFEKLRCRQFGQPDPAMYLKETVYQPQSDAVEKYNKLYRVYCNLVKMFNPKKYDYDYIKWIA